MQRKRDPRRRSRNGNRQDTIDLARRAVLSIEERRFLMAVRNYRQALNARRRCERLAA